MNEDLKKHLLNIETFQRLALMVLFVLIFTVVKLVIYAVAIFQLLHLLFTGSTHDELKTFGSSLSIFTFDITKFLTFDTEELPFPFKPWPSQEEAHKKPVHQDESDETDADETHA
jgi:hypothetical protein